MEDTVPVKIWFKIDQEEDGPAPVAAEGLWAFHVAGDLFRVANVPFWVCSLAMDDVVRTVVGEDELRWAVERAEWGGRMTIRVKTAEEGDPTASQQEVFVAVMPFGVTGESSSTYGRVALDVGPEADHKSLKSLLKAKEAAGVWYYEEGCVTDDWLQL